MENSTVSTVSARVNFDVSAPTEDALNAVLGQVWGVPLGGSVTFDKLVAVDGEPVAGVPDASEDFGFLTVATFDVTVEVDTDDDGLRDMVEFALNSIVGETINGIEFLDIRNIAEETTCPTCGHTEMADTAVYETI